MKKLKLTYIPIKGCLYCPGPHYDLHMDGKRPYSVACIATDAKGAKLIRKWVRKHNEGGHR